MNSYEDATDTGPVDGDPPAPAAPEAPTHNLAESERLHELVNDLRLELEEVTTQRDQATLEVKKLQRGVSQMARAVANSDRCIDYLAAVAEDNDHAYIVESLGEEDQQTSVLMADPLDPDQFTRTTFVNTGQVGHAASLIADLHAALAESRAEAIVEAEIYDVPEWAETVDVMNVAMVGATAHGQISIQNGGPFQPTQAMVTAATLYTMAEMHLDDAEDGFDYILERVRNS